MLRTLFILLYKSVTSIEFYKDVHTKFKGYGIKFIFIVLFISSIGMTLNVYLIIDSVNDYLETGRENHFTSKIEQVLNEIPELEYRDGKLSSELTDPKFIYLNSKNPLALIDLKNKTNSYSESKEIVHMSEDYININTMFPFKLYWGDLFGQQEIFIDKNYIKNSIKSILKKIDIWDWVSIFRNLFLVLIIRLCLDRGLIIGIMWLVAYLSGIRLSLKTIIRLSLFSCGASIMVESCLLIFTSFIAPIVNILHLWTNLLMVLGAVRANKGREF